MLFKLQSEIGYTFTCFSPAPPDCAVFSAVALSTGVVFSVGSTADASDFKFYIHILVRLLTEEVEVLLRSTKQLLQ